MKYYLIAGEPSGDALGGRLMKAIRTKDKKAEFFGLGSESMQAQGLKSLFNVSELAVMGIAEVIPSIPRILRRMSETVADIVRVQPDVIITIDSWSFSARIHKRIRKLNLNIPQVHYVAPQVWAWKKKRARTMYKYIDLLLTLFPNEPKYFTPYHLETVFVGHPVIESTLVNGNFRGQFKKANKIPVKNRLMLVLPGSRHNEVDRLLPDFLEVVKTMHKKYPDFSFAIPTVSTVSEKVHKMVKASGLPITIVEGEDNRRNAFQDADVAIAASGTVALELAIINIPHIIAYKVPKLTEWIARHFIHIQYVNLTNILLGREIVPELLQQDCNPANIMSYVEQFLASKPIYHRQMEGFDKVRKLLGMDEQTPSENAADTIIKFVKRKHEENMA
ncbi:MAG: lipid-A-disaccharide synthase [Alphaproteobacteria bacterium]|nr:lipid-A-disaccharide synthase [Alphaproteobacteria bacterium]